MKLKSKKQQALDAELGLIIDEMGKAMWGANKEYIARGTAIINITPNMRIALDKFKAFCEAHYGE
jgi:hypothetical protein